MMRSEHHDPLCKLAMTRNGTLPADKREEPRQKRKIQIYNKLTQHCR